ncbi:hypothetical protein [Sphingobium cupriresistens]|uniref:hypothetical protein n=1 Tax=Sphingobium cupriresistens TaxID=1132417 RepID=UPI003BF4E20F
MVLALCPAGRQHDRDIDLSANGEVDRRDKISDFTFGWDGSTAAGDAARAQQRAQVLAELRLVQMIEPLD